MKVKLLQMTFHQRIKLAIALSRCVLMKMKQHLWIVPKQLIIMSRRPLIMVKLIDSHVYMKEAKRNLLVHDDMPIPLDL